LKLERYREVKNGSRARMTRANREVERNTTKGGIGAKKGEGNGRTSKHGREKRSLVLVRNTVVFPQVSHSARSRKLASHFTRSEPSPRFPSPFSCSPGRMGWSPLQEARSLRGVRNPNNILGGRHLSYFLFAQRVLTWSFHFTPGAWVALCHLRF